MLICELVRMAGRSYSLEKHAKTFTAATSDPPQGAAVALIGQRAVLSQLHAIARRTSRPFDGDHRQALPLQWIRSGFMSLFGHAALRPVSPDVRRNMREYPEFHRFFA